MEKKRSPKVIKITTGEYKETVEIFSNASDELCFLIKNKKGVRSKNIKPKVVNTRLYPPSSAAIPAIHRNDAPQRLVIRRKAE